MANEWRKAIPEKRDRLQSRVLVWVVGSSVLLFSLFLLVAAIATRHYRSELMALKALGVSLTFAGIVWALRAATPMAAVYGGSICFIVTVGTGRTNESLLRSGLAPLFLLFLLTFIASRAGRARKAALGLAENKRGRNAAQVLANLGMAGLIVVAAFLDFIDWAGRGVGLISFSAGVMPVLLLAALCEATADTVSSEIGAAFGGRPFLLTTFRRVEPGTDGAVSLLGTVAGIVAAALISGVGMWATHMERRESEIALAGGLAGLIFDSVLGATAERRGWLGNDLVNFSSTVFAVAVALLLAR